MFTGDPRVPQTHTRTRVTNPRPRVRVCVWVSGGTRGLCDPCRFDMREISFEHGNKHKMYITKLLWARHERKQQLLSLQTSTRDRQTM